MRQAYISPARKSARLFARTRKHLGGTLQEVYQVGSTLWQRSLCQASRAFRETQPEIMRTLTTSATSATEMVELADSFHATCLNRVVPPQIVGKGQGYRRCRRVKWLTRTSCTHAAFAAGATHKYNPGAGVNCPSVNVFQTPSSRSLPRISMFPTILRFLPS